MHYVIHQIMLDASENVWVYIYDSVISLVHTNSCSCVQLSFYKLTRDRKLRYNLSHQPLMIQLVILVFLQSCEIKTWGTIYLAHLSCVIMCNHFQMCWNICFEYASFYRTPYTSIFLALYSTLSISCFHRLISWHEYLQDQALYLLAARPNYYVPPSLQKTKKKV